MPWKCELSPGRHETPINELGQAKKFWQQRKQILTKHYLCDPVLLQTLHPLPSEHPFHCPARYHHQAHSSDKKVKGRAALLLKADNWEVEGWDLNPGNTHHSECFLPKSNSQECANNTQDRCKTHMVPFHSYLSGC